MSGYFNVNHTPVDEFGRLLFDEFDESEWILFDNFLLDCIRQYLIHGLVKAESINLEVRRFMSATSHEFYDFVTDNYIPINERFNRTAKYNEFKQQYPDFVKLSERKFHNWIESYCRYIKAEHKTGRNSAERYSYIIPLGSESPADIENEMPF
jgi:hypothetical protein